MKAMLIGDVGSTSAQWAWISHHRQCTFSTSGYNPVQHTPQSIDRMLASVAEHIPGKFEMVHYYGSGVISASILESIQHAFCSQFGELPVKCESDMLGAARAVSPGYTSVVCILGTGSNSCLFGGDEIIRQLPSLGFPLGDEGSGADIGAVCVRDFYYKTMPDEAHAAFARVLPADRTDFLEHYRNHEAPNRYLASLVPVVATLTDLDYIREMLRTRFRTFARLHIAPYHAEYPVHCLGGVAFAFRDLLSEVLLEENLISGMIVKNPLAGLIEFHQEQL